MLPEFFCKNENKTIAYWEETRRPEIIKQFSTEIYGVTPKETPAMTSQIIEEETLTNGVIKQVVILSFVKDFKQTELKLLIYKPKHAKGKIPAIIMLNPFSRNSKFDHDKRDPQHMPYDLITAHGYAAVYSLVDWVSLDDKEEYQKGVLELYPQTDKHSWGAIGAWSWAGSRTIDYLTKREDIVNEKIALAGFSRGGKAALWCAAQDSRVALVISVASGCSGAAITRGKTGEQINDITALFPHWFAKRYSDYADDVEALPVDQHMLIGSIAPRCVYVSSSSEDSWADPCSEFKSLIKSGEIFQLYGYKTLDDSYSFPEVNKQISKGRTGYHQRKGAHLCTREDWKMFLLFIDTHFKQG